MYNQYDETIRPSHDRLCYLFIFCNVISWKKIQKLPQICLGAKQSIKVFGTQSIEESTFGVYIPKSILPCPGIATRQVCIGVSATPSLMFNLTRSMHTFSVLPWETCFSSTQKVLPVSWAHSFPMKPRTKN